MPRNALSSFRAVTSALALAGLAHHAVAQGISGGEVRIGVLTDLSGVYSDASGRGSVLAAQMAIDDFVAQNKPNFKIKLLSADMQLKPDVGASIARTWFDREGVDMVTDIPSSAVTLAVMNLAVEKNRVVIPVGPASLRITNDDCNATTIHWAYDEYSQGQGTARAITESGKKSWFFIEADYAGGKALRAGFEEAIKAAGGTVVGAAKHALGAGDFSSQIVQAQASKADVIGMANAAGDSANLLKQSAEFGVTPRQVIAASLTHITDVHALGLKAARGLFLTDGFYWDRNDASRAWSQRFFAQRKKMPTMVQVGTYSAVLHYLKGVQAAGTDEAGAVVAAMKKLPVNDVFAENGRVREDGRMVHDMYLFEVKAPEESKKPWDYYKLKAVIPAEKAFRPIEQSTCRLVRKQG
ncbi:ABC transporter substrate-binding protein [Alicycliphilus denitrificans]|uniref:ABC transporter substrate-binding protein n=1 Tax=Alicycliphilus denitrificans TaxID=179636 RepID=A0A3R7HUU9_9BURK|nr:ABC transporter substrate-binding protein [Alicycliphilus denitrificans]RKJ96289.1 ABC transporter substrate-binding protein [Alicycliphilus denitrificans]